MYLHLEKNESVHKAELVGVFDIETATTSAVTREMLSDAQKKHRVVNLSGDLPKTFIISETRLAETVYLTSLPTASYKTRLNNIR